MYGTKKNQNISEIFFDPSTDKLILVNDGRVIVKTTGCKLSLIKAGRLENLVFDKQNSYYSRYWKIVKYFTIYLSKAHFPLVEAPSGNNSKDFVSSSAINFFNTVLSVVIFSLGNVDTRPKNKATGTLNTVVGWKFEIKMKCNNLW